MRPPMLKEGRRSHLQPCPRCGEANGVTAIACWKCDLQLVPDHLLEKAAADPRPPADTVPRIETEVAAEELQQLEAGRGHRGPHTLPPVASRDGATANDPRFGSPWASPLFRLTWAVAGLALAASLLAWLVPRTPAERPAQRSATSTVTPDVAPPAVMSVAATPAPRAVPAADAPVPATAPAIATARPSPPQQPVSQQGVTARAASPPPAPATVAAQHPPPAAAEAQTPAGPPPGAVPATPPTVEARAADPPAVRAPRPRPAAPRTTAAPLAAAREQQEAAVRRIDAEAARRPPPVEAPCTPQVAALGLCTPEPR